MSTLKGCTITENVACVYADRFDTVKVKRKFEFLIFLHTVVSSLSSGIINIRQRF